METLTIAADFGASLGKAIYHDGSPEPKLILLKPEIISLPSTSVDAYCDQFSLSGSHPEETAWLRIDDRFYILGELAKHRCRVEAHLDEPKYNKAINQCLAIIGSVLQREKSTPSQLNLAIVLPYDEFQYKEEFEFQLRKVLLSFTFRGIDYSLKLNLFTCLPEGSGLYLRGRAAKKGKLLRSPKDITIAIVMMGYRNISLMVIDKGVGKVKKTTMQGFVQMINLIRERVPVVDEFALIRAMSKPRKIQRQLAYHRLAVCDDEEIRKKEVEKLESAIKFATLEYKTIIFNFLDANLKQFEVNEFVIGGGTANYLRSELRKYFSSFKAEISWAEALEQRIEQTFTQQIRKQSLAYRLSDVYGLFYYFLNKPLPTIKEEYYDGETIKI